MSPPPFHPTSRRRIETHPRLAHVRMLRPVRPVPGLFMAEAWVEREEGGKVVVKAELSDGAGTVFDTCESVLGAPKRRREQAAGARSKL